MDELRLASQWPLGWRAVGMAGAAVLLSMLAAVACSSKIVGIDTGAEVVAANGGSAATDAMRDAYRLQRSEAPAVTDVPAPALTMQGRGKQGRIVDAAGNVVWQASESAPLYGLQVSPDGRQVVLYFGDSEFSLRAVANLAAGTPLPVRPAQPGATGFSDWYWLDDQRLLGVAEMPAASHPAGATAAEDESQPPEAVVLSVFDVRDPVLEPVEIAEDLPAVFEVGEVRDDSVELRIEGEADPVWAKLRASAME